MHRLQPAFTCPHAALQRWPCCCLAALVRILAAPNTLDVEPHRLHPQPQEAHPGQTERASRGSCACGRGMGWSCRRAACLQEHRRGQDRRASQMDAAAGGAHRGNVWPVCTASTQPATSSRTAQWHAAGFPTLQSTTAAQPFGSEGRQACCSCVAHSLLTLALQAGRQGGGVCLVQQGAPHHALNAQLSHLLRDCNRAGVRRGARAGGSRSGRVGVQAGKEPCRWRVGSKHAGVAGMASTAARGMH